MLRYTFIWSNMKNHINDNVLVLNRLWQAVNVCTVGRAFALLCNDHAQVVHEDSGNFLTFGLNEWADFSNDYVGDEVVRTSSVKFRVPRIILLLLFDRIIGKDVKFTRHNIYERDKDTCQYCGKRFKRSEMNLDHVIPRDMGGSTNWDNIVCACIKCNTKKANRTPHQANMRLLRKPKRPKWRPMMKVEISHVYHPDWKHFLDLAYWNVELTSEIK